MFMDGTSGSANRPSWQNHPNWRFRIEFQAARQRLHTGSLSNQTSRYGTLESPSFSPSPSPCWKSSRYDSFVCRLALDNDPSSRTLSDLDFPRLESDVRCTCHQCGKDSTCSRFKTRPTLHTLRIDSRQAQAKRRRPPTASPVLLRPLLVSYLFPTYAV